MEVIAVSQARSWPDWRTEIDCEKCADWEGTAPVPLWEARRRYPPELGFEVRHGHYLTKGEDSKMVSIPTTIVKHPGMYAQFIPDLPHRA
jgi:hypothetical protein